MLAKHTVSTLLEDHNTVVAYRLETKRPASRGGADITFQVCAPMRGCVCAHEHGPHPSNVRSESARLNFGLASDRMIL